MPCHAQEHVLCCELARWSWCDAPPTGSNDSKLYSNVPFGNVTQGNAMPGVEHHGMAEARKSHPECNRRQDDSMRLTIVTTNEN